MEQIIFKKGNRKESTMNEINTGRRIDMHDWLLARSLKYNTYLQHTYFSVINYIITLLYDIDIFF